MRRMKTYLVGEIVNSDQNYLIGTVFNYELGVKKLETTSVKETWDILNEVHEKLMNEANGKLKAVDGLYSFKGHFQLAFGEEKKVYVEAIFRLGCQEIDSSPKPRKVLTLRPKTTEGFETWKKELTQWITEAYPNKFSIISFHRMRTSPKINFFWREDGDRKCIEIEEA